MSLPSIVLPSGIVCDPPEPGGVLLEVDGVSPVGAGGELFAGDPQPASIVSAAILIAKPKRKKFFMNALPKKTMSIGVCSTVELPLLSASECYSVWPFAYLYALDHLMSHGVYDGDRAIHNVAHEGAPPIIADDNAVRAFTGHNG